MAKQKKQSQKDVGDEAVQRRDKCFTDQEQVPGRFVRLHPSLRCAEAAGAGFSNARPSAAGVHEYQKRIAKTKFTDYAC